MIVICTRKCWDSTRNRSYYPGDQDDIDPLEPIAGNFDFPPGTEVYWKKPGTKTTPAISTTRIVPGQVEEKSRLKAVKSEEAALLKRLETIKREKDKLKGAIGEDKKPEEPPAKDPEPVDDVKKKSTLP